jgi:putative ABC transport system permease protein
MMRRKRALEVLEQQIRDHLEQETHDNIERGLSPDEARHAAVRKFGNVALVKEDVRAVWTPIWIEQFLQDVRYGLRMLRRNPGFTAVAIVTLALGIGITASVFSVFNAVLLRPLAYPHPDRLVWVSLYGGDLPPRWTPENRPSIDSSKPATTG